MASQVLPLMNVNRLHVRQKHTVFTNNKYVFTTSGGEVVFYAKEHSSVANVFMGNDRPFYMDLFDAYHKEVIHLRRPMTFAGDKVEVSIGSQVVAKIYQQLTFMKPVYLICDPAGRPVLKVKGPSNFMGLSFAVDFDVLNTNKTKIGSISKCWSGTARELFTTADNYVISFPEDLHVNYKAALIGACMLIDFNLFEK